MEEVASLPDKVQITPMVMDSRRVITVCPEAPARTTERVEVVEAVTAMAAAAAEVIAVIRIGDLFIPAAAKAPKKMGDVPEEHGIKKKISSVPPFQMGGGADLGKIPSTKTETWLQAELMLRL